MKKQLLVVLALGACAALAQGQMVLYEDFEDYEVDESIHFKGTDTTEFWGEVPRWYAQDNTSVLRDHTWSRVQEYGGNRVLEMQARGLDGSVSAGVATAMSMESVQITGEGTIYLRYAVNQEFRNMLLTNDLEPGWDYDGNALQGAGTNAAIGWQGGTGSGAHSYNMHGAIAGLGGDLPFNAYMGTGYADGTPEFVPPIQTWIEFWMQFDSANHRSKFFICEQGGTPVQMMNGDSEWWGWRNDGWTNNGVKNLKFILSNWPGPYEIPNTIYLDTIGVNTEAMTLERVGPDTLPDIWAVEPPALPGDANGDGVVDLDDFVLLKTNFGATDATWAMGDFNGDGVVDLDDFVILKTNFGATAPVPEPMTLSLLALGGLALIRRRS